MHVSKTMFWHIKSWFGLASDASICLNHVLAYNQYDTGCDQTIRQTSGQHVNRSNKNGKRKEHPHRGNSAQRPTVATEFFRNDRQRSKDKTNQRTSSTNSGINITSDNDKARARTSPVALYDLCGPAQWFDSTAPHPESESPPN